MSKAALSEFVRFAKYAKHNDALGRRETWKEQVTRMFDMHRVRYGYEIENNTELKELVEYAEKMVVDKRILGSQRALQYGGKAILKKNARLYNCSATYADRYNFFQHLVYLTMCGCGVGFSVQYRHTNMMPSFKRREDGEAVFVVPDTMEGWADAIGVLVSSYAVDTSKAPFPAFSGKKITFDYSRIRPEGSKISSGGKCPGPQPLRGCIENCERTLDAYLADASEIKLKPIQIYNLAMYMAGAIVSGGIRRSATICLFSMTDKEMMEAKTGNWFEHSPHWQNSNNSVVLVRGQVTREDFNNIFSSTKQFGEPGFIWADNEDVLFNPCSEIGLVGYLENGNLKDGKPWEGDDYAMGKVESGVEFCNLSEVNGAKVKNVIDFYEACKAASILGTMQAGYTDIDYISGVSKKIIEKEALIGVSITGMMELPDVLLDPDIQREGAKIVKEWNAIVASMIGINQAARCTCIKPSGTASSLLETSPGIHPHHSRRYLRRVRANRNETALKFYKSKNPSSVEIDFSDPNGITEIITFICDAGKSAKTKTNTSAIDLLKSVHITQRNWVEEGTREEASIIKNIRHNVSNTIHVDSGEWEEVRDYLYDNRSSFAGVSMLSVSGDKDYNQAPYSSVMYPEELVNKFGPGAIMASGLIVEGMRAWQNDLWAACDALTGMKSVEYKLAVNDALHYYILGDRHTWVNRAKNFSNRYFNGDVSTMISCLKEVQCLFVWEKIARNYTEVDWSECHEAVDGTKIQYDVACAGGACDVTSI
jgi:ribonucleoside-diphosphate reductase alpha chain